jgi:hypothetical protein
MDVLLPENVRAPVKEHAAKLEKKTIDLTMFQKLSTLDKIYSLKGRSRHRIPE